MERTTGSWTRKPARQVGARRFERYVVRTHLVRPGERLTSTLTPYLAGQVQPGDIVVVGEKIVAIAEGRAIPLRAVRPRRLARWLARHVRPLGYGLGLRRPETMEMALREAGVARILVAAAVAAVGRLLGRSGDFYRVAGRRVASIDGPGPTTIAPYNRYIVLAPKNSQDFADGLARRLGCGVAVVDVNDVGSEVLAASAGVDAALVRELLRDNPMGQGSQRTPVAVLRPAAAGAEPRWPRVAAPEPHPVPAAIGGLGFGLAEPEAGRSDAHAG
jgi:hypothetical protein